jgi:hypothetical protein
MSKNGKAKTAQPSAKDVFDNLVRACTPRPAKNETPEQEAARMDAAVRKIAGVPLSKVPVPTERKAHSWSSALHGAVAIRWGVAAKTLRSFFPRPNGRDPRRRPKLSSMRQFYEDLRTYGGARFDDAGKLDRSTLNTGPDPVAFINYMPAGSDKPLEA